MGVQILPLAQGEGKWEKKLNIFVQLDFSCNAAPDAATSTNLVEGFSFCTEFKSGREEVRQLPKWSWHIFSQITTDLFSKGDDYRVIKIKLN